MIDRKDRDILRVIQTKGRIPIVELAAAVNLTKSPCLQRLRRLEKNGVIRGYRADIDPKKVQKGYLVYVQVKLESTRRTALEGFNLAVKNIPEVLACHMLSGGYDYLMKIRTSDMDAFRELLGGVIAELPNVNQTDSYPVMEEIIDTSVIQIPESDFQ
ncbi:Lrp/AsnC family transcriptional regulator [Hirschia baltica]|uniref:Transcriptional regulator, AsnC family n=1 Tax=Hirschia baltica (strain ATCC 49814 / DSM 5838 / IFAM 1418) TaxID=582402 RepID=C6XJL9_HIRBI|nr:Lrp/AsnC ligand binding domain-containing protein [Hirschia baltica]ACT59314.1 transcriptional regulator, AsnC family [Hirschia baltica ATCC 49814]